MQKKGVSKALLLIVLAVLVIGGGFGAYMLLGSSGNIEIKDADLNIFPQNSMGRDYRFDYGLNGVAFEFDSEKEFEGSANVKVFTKDGELVGSSKERFISDGTGLQRIELGKFNDAFSSDIIVELPERGEYVIYLEVFDDKQKSLGVSASPAYVGANEMPVNKDVNITVSNLEVTCYDPNESNICGNKRRSFDFAIQVENIGNAPLIGVFKLIPIVEGVAKKPFEVELADGWGDDGIILVANPESSKYSFSREVSTFSDEVEGNAGDEIVLKVSFVDHEGDIIGEKEIDPVLITPVK